MDSNEFDALSLSLSAVESVLGLGLELKLVVSTLLEVEWRVLLRRCRRDFIFFSLLSLPPEEGRFSFFNGRSFRSWRGLVSFSLDSKI